MIRFDAKITGLREFATRLEEAPGKAQEAGRLAVNAGARRFATESSKAIRSKLAFPARYLYNAGNPLAGKISVRLASNKTGEAVVKGADRPTMLSRFSPNVASWSKGKRVQPRVQVAPGKSVTLNRGFFLQFPNGVKAIAVRLKPGERMVNRKLGNAYPLAGSPGVFVLYGPSVDQALRMAGDDIFPDAGDFINAEFDRQWVRLTRK